MIVLAIEAVVAEMMVLVLHTCHALGAYLPICQIECTFPLRAFIILGWVG